MKSPLPILHLEDDVNDAALVKTALEAAGIACAITRVENKSDFLAALERGGIDLIISDFTLPKFDGLSAVALVHARWPAIPLIFVSGTMGEERAIESLKSGATDFVLKEHLARLAPAVRRAMDEVGERGELKRVEASLIRLAAIVESSDDAIISEDLNSVIISWNRGAENILGYSAEEMVGRTNALLVPADRQEEQKQFLARARQGESVRQFETVRLARDGRRVDVSVTVSPIKNANGETVGVAKVARDITERKQTEAALREEQEMFRRLADTIPDTIYFKDRQSRFVRINQAMARHLGLKDVSEAVGKTDYDFHGQEHARQAFDDEQKAMTTGESLIGCDEQEKWSDGRITWASSTKVPLRDAEGNITGLVGISRDITERRKLEEQFRQSQKMEGIGQLAGGVAHDFNNILAVIQIQSELLKASGPLAPAQLDYANEIGAATQRAAALTRQLLLFSRKETLQLGDLDLNPSINNTTNMLRRILGEDIQIQFKFSMESLLIHADAGMIDQVLMNLTVNARDAMPTGGRLLIETSVATFTEPISKQLVQARAGSFVCLSVSDTGCGIPADNLARIFEPFFTTKDIGKGTGLGLATVFGIVQQHQGWINVYSEVGHGTTFRIYLPRIAGVAPLKVEKPVLTAMRGGDETILLVEDDPFLHAAVCKILAPLGYRVLEAFNGAEALEIWGKHRDEIHLLLTDLVMPGGMTGKELAKKLLAEAPKLKVIYSSGYSAGIASDDFPLKEGLNFITKPFEAHKLAQVVRERLDAIA